MRAAVGTPLLVIVINSTSGLVAHLRQGLDLVTMGLFIRGSTLGVLSGAIVSGRLNARRQRGFALFITAASLWLMETTWLRSSRACRESDRYAQWHISCAPPNAIMDDR